MSILSTHLYVWKFKPDQEGKYQEFTQSINSISLLLINSLIVIGMVLFVLIDFFRNVNYSFVLLSRLSLTLVALIIIWVGWDRKLSPIKIDLLLTLSLIALSVFALVTAFFGQMPPFFLTNISITILVFVATISGLRFRHTLLFNFLYLTTFILYSLIIQSSEFYFSQYSNLVSMFIYSSLAGLLIEIRRRNNFIQYEDLLHQKEKVEDLNQQKNKIISVLSHDVASPLNSLSGLLHLQSNGTVTGEEIKPFLHEVGNRLDSVSALLQGLVRWSRSQLSGFILEKGNHDLINLTEGVVKLFQPTANEKHLKLNLNTDKPGIIVNVDEEMIRIALRNLVSNAIKFAKSGTTVRIDIGENTENVLVKITNSGSIIPASVQSKLFGFHVSSTLGTSGEKGTGLGLVMAAHFVRLNEGQIFLENSNKEIGTTFCISLPRQNIT